MSSIANYGYYTLLIMATIALLIMATIALLIMVFCNTCPLF